MFWSKRIEDVVQVAAYMVGATEAAVFRRPDMALLVHIRPDEADAALRAAAIAAFKELIEQTNGKDAVIEGDAGFAAQSHVLPYAGYRPQYCLIAFPSDGCAADAVVAVIVRCADDREAARKLERLEGIL
jgi:hypothetical protein